MKKTILVFSGLILALVLLFQLSTYSIHSGNLKTEVAVAIIAVVFLIVGIYINKKSLHKQQEVHKDINHQKIKDLELRSKIDLVILHAMIRRITALFFLGFASVCFAQLGGESTYQFLNLISSPRQAALGGKIITNVDKDVFKILKDPKILKKLEAGKYPSITDISKITKLDPVLSEIRLMDLAEKLANTKYANVAKNYLENTSLVDSDSPFGGSKGKKARVILENRFTKGMNIDQKLPAIRSNILKEIYKMCQKSK